ncbi:MAG: hypothetical protein Kow0075_02880 [Salibacteraceae bacterium]
MTTYFHEKQYLGYNRYGIIRRLGVALFCLVYYFMAQANDPYAVLFFYIGVALVAVSALAILISHLETRLYDHTLHLIGPMTFRQVKFDIGDLSGFKKTQYSRFLLNRPMFNLHKGNSLRFYTHGKWCIEFETNDGTTVKLGTQRPDELLNALQMAKAEASNSTA